MIHPKARRFRFPCAAFLALAWLTPAPAGAVLDIEDQGPMLDVGRFGMRITNAGILGNAFFDKGLSNDPSFEFPSHSGHECLNHAVLWVGGVDDDAVRHVSGGPLLEWRPTLDPADTVRIARYGRLGSQRNVDDDGDGRVDEEILNDRDDDGDGETDEDLGLFSQELAAADYVDDRPEAIYYGYPTGETHIPMHLSVHQEAMAWVVSGYNSIAAVQYTITNHGSRAVRDVYIGLLADLDSRRLADRTGHRNDRIEKHAYSATFNHGTSRISIGGVFPSCALPSACVATVRQTVPVLVDGVPSSGLPVVAVVGLDHSTDPLAFITPARKYARAPGKTSFRYTVFSNSRIPGQGGLPVVDSERYRALAGDMDWTPTEEPDDYVVLVSCGPFPVLAPGQSVQFAVALVAGESRDSLQVGIENAFRVEHGTITNLLPDSTGRGSTEWNVGNTGLNGHEVCLAAPPGVEFDWEPHCGDKFSSCDMGPPPEMPLAHYTSGHCIWTDADCDNCTGTNGRETVTRWLDPGEVPPSPPFELIPGDHRVTIAWSNLPEALLKGGAIGTRETQFVGYRIWKLSDWTKRGSLMPPQETWALFGAYAHDTLNGEARLTSITDSTLDYERILYEQKVYPVGRYSVVDTTSLNGFDYAYVVGTVYNLAQRLPNGLLMVRQLESPIVTTFDQRVRPAAAAHTRAGGVWVVPNPFRARADWDLPVVPGDPLPRHLDFMGLPRAVATIRIYTVAGDFVAQIVHDGRNGNGQAAWDLISRNGQDVESGIYLFTVGSSYGQSVGRFVVIR